MLSVGWAGKFFFQFWNKFFMIDKAVKNKSSISPSWKKIFEVKKKIFEKKINDIFVKVINNKVWTDIVHFN